MTASGPTDDYDGLKFIDDNNLVEDQVIDVYDQVNLNKEQITDDLWTTWELHHLSSRKGPIYFECKRTLYFRQKTMSSKQCKS